MTNRRPAAESISFHRRGDEYVLVRSDKEGKKSTLVLSEANVLFLPRILQKVIGQILDERSDQAMKKIGASPIAAVSIVNARLNRDLSGSEVLLTVRDKFWNENSFAITFDIAQPLAERMLQLTTD